MKRHARNAFNALKAMGAPVIDHGNQSEQWGAHFILSAERYHIDDKLWADYYQEEVREHEGEDGQIKDMFGIRTEVHEILNKYGLFSEWIDGGTVGIYDA